MMTSKVAWPLFSAASRAVRLNWAIGSSSLSMMSSWALLRASRVALVGGLKVRLTISFGSSAPSSRIDTVKLWLVSPGSKIRLSLAAV